MKKQLRSYSIIAIGSLIFALAFDLFFAPNRIATGGTPGLAQVINALLPAIPVGAGAIALNVPVFLLGWRYLGFRLLATSLFSMAVSSLAIDAIQAVHPFQAMDPFLACLCGGALLGLGLGIVFSQGATTGGMDVVARLLKLKLPWLPIGKLVLLPNAAVLALAAVTFGRLETALYGAVSLFVTTRVMDAVLERGSAAAVACVLTDRWRELADALRADGTRKVSLLGGGDACTGAEQRTLLVVFRQQELAEVKRVVHETDSRAFFIACDAREALGEGFGTFNKEAF